MQQESQMLDGVVQELLQNLQEAREEMARSFP